MSIVQWLRGSKRFLKFQKKKNVEEFVYDQIELATGWNGYYDRWITINNWYYVCMHYLPLFNFEYVAVESKAPNRLKKATNWANKGADAVIVSTILFIYSTHYFSFSWIKIDFKSTVIVNTHNWLKSNLFPIRQWVSINLLIFFFCSLPFFRFTSLTQFCFFFSCLHQLDFLFAEDFLFSEK